jgi:hypothetical protein
MVDDLDFESEFFELLTGVDRAVTQRVAAAGCRQCDGPLHRSDYPRKPRGALIAPAGEGCVSRFSLCCGREGCRKRATPPSVRFLGRRVYLGVVVLVASIVAQSLRAAGKSRRQTGVPGRTVRRWQGWWQGSFLKTAELITICARLVGVEVGRVPASIVERLGGTGTQPARRMLELLAPLTTGSVPDGSRFLRGAP